MQLGNCSKTLLFSSLFIILPALLGCAEGPLWRSGKLSPWARNQWAEEEKIADTFFSKKKTMNESVAAVQNAPVEDQQKVALDLSAILQHDPVLLIRLHAIRLLGQLECPAAINALTDASQDRNSDIRIASIKAWEKMPPESAIPSLQEIIGSDTNVDVRLAATQSLSHFSGQRAVLAISLALNDSDPALQLRAAESLEQITGESLGPDIQAWKAYVKNVAPSQGLPSDTLVDSPANRPQPKVSTANATNDFQSMTDPQSGTRYK